MAPETEYINREMALLLACAHSHPTAAQADRVWRLAQPAISWDALIQSGQEHDVQPLLYASLATICPDAVPAATLAALKSWVHANNTRSLILTRELARLIRSLDERGVSALPFKGPLLAEMAYGNIALRHSIDLDVLITGSDVDRALSAMTGLGYAFTSECRQHEQAYRNVHNHLALENGARTMVELHWRLAPRHFSLRLKFSDLWQRRAPIALGGARLDAPCAEDMLLLISVHGALHGWKQLKNVCDVAELVQHQPVDWPAVWQRAHSIGVERMVLLGLSLCRDLLQTPLPDDIVARLSSDTTLPRLKQMIFPVMLGSQARSNGSDTRSFSAYYACLRERRRDRIEEALRRTVIPTIPEWTSLPLPRPLSFLHYVMRPLRLGRRSLRAWYRRSN